MPWAIKDGHVVNKETGKPVNKKPLPHKRLVKLMRRLYAMMKKGEIK